MSESLSITDCPIAYQFKGGRDYVHGTDIYTSITHTVAKHYCCSAPVVLTQFKLAIRKQCQHHCRLDVSSVDSKLSRPAAAVVEFQFRSGDHRYVGWLSETQMPVTENYAYSEDRAMNACLVVENTVNSVNTYELSTIENLVAATKRLHAAQFPDVCGKWFFSRLELPQLLPDQQDQQLTLALNQSVGQRLTRSDIHIANEPFGSIYFSLVTA